MQRARLCAILMEQTGETVEPFAAKAQPSSEQIAKSQLSDIEKEMKAIDCDQDNSKEELSPEQLWNIRCVDVL